MKAYEFMTPEEAFEKWASDTEDPDELAIQRIAWLEAVKWAAEEDIKHIMAAASLFGDPFTSNDPICAALVEMAKAIRARLEVKV